MREAAMSSGIGRKHECETAVGKEEDAEESSRRSGVSAGE